MHLHLATVGGRWLTERGIPTAGTNDHLEWELKTLGPLIEAVTSDMARVARSGRPTAYRAGAYRANDALIDALAVAGYKTDSSYDHIHADHHSLAEGIQVGNEPFVYRGLLEVPITCFEDQGKKRRLVPPFGSTPDDLDRRGLEALRIGGCRAVNYIFHSYDLTTLRASDGARAYGTANPRLCGWLDDTLDWIAARPDDFQVVTLQELHQRLSP